MPFAFSSVGGANGGMPLCFCLLEVNAKIEGCLLRFCPLEVEIEGCPCDFVLWILTLRFCPLEVKIEECSYDFALLELTIEGCP